MPNNNNNNNKKEAEISKESGCLDELHIIIIIINFHLIISSWSPKRQVKCKIHWVTTKVLVGVLVKVDFSK